MLRFTVNFLSESKMLAMVDFDFSYYRSIYFCLVKNLTLKKQLGKPVQVNQFGTKVKTIQFLELMFTLSILSHYLVLVILSPILDGSPWLLLLLQVVLFQPDGGGWVIKMFTVWKCSYLSMYRYNLSVNYLLLSF